MAGQEDVGLLLEQVRLDHLMVEASRRLMEVLVSKQVHKGAALGLIYFGNLE